MSTIDRQWAYLNEHRDTLAKQYSGKFIVISDALNVSEFNTLEDAYCFGEREYGLGHFLLQDCRPGYIGKIQIISPSIVFA